MKSSFSMTYIGVGANQPSPVGAPYWTLIAVQRNLEHAGARLSSVSSLYRTEPVGILMGRVFINQVVACRLPCSARLFLRRLKRIEQLYGRKLGRAARPLDLDILDSNDYSTSRQHRQHRQQEQNLHCTLPHPRIFKRRFALLPLAELAPRHILGKRSVQHWLARSQGAVFLLRR